MFLCSQMVRFGTCAQARSARSSEVTIPQQRKLIGSSAQSGSGVHWCRRRVRFNKVSEKVPKAPVKVWEPLVQSQVRFNRVPEKVPDKKIREALVQSQVRFNRVPERGSGEGLGGSGAEPGQAQQGCRRFCKGLGVFGAQPGQVQQGLGGGSGEGSEKVWEAFGAEPIPGEGSGEGRGGFGAGPGQVQQGSGEGPGLVQSQVRFNRFPRRFWRRSGRLWCRARFTRVSEKVLEKVPGGFGAEPSQAQQCFREGSGEGFERLWCRARSGSTGGSSALLGSTRQKDL